MRSLRVTLLALPILAAAAPAPRRAPPERCAGDAVTQARDTDGVARFRRLGDLPPANATLTLLRTEDGCDKPVTIRYGIGDRTHQPAGGSGRRHPG